MSTPALLDLSSPYRLQRRAFFWQVHVPPATTTALVRHGRVTAAGRAIVKDFDTSVAAQEWARDAVQAKLQDGYSVDGDEKMTDKVDVKKEEDVQSRPRRSSRKRAAPLQFSPGEGGKHAKKEVKPESLVARKPGKKPKVEAKVAKTTGKKPGKNAAAKVKRGLRGEAAVDVTAPLGVVDPAAESDGAIYTETDDHANPVIYDVMLVLFDKALHHDKFIVLQLIGEESANQWKLYERWGRTGTSGTSLTTTFDEDKLEEALEAFRTKFTQKTGLEWEERGEDPVQGKYRFVMQDFERKAEMTVSDVARWQYWVDDGVDGKVTGWYDYDASGNVLAEQLYMEFQNNPWLIERVVASGMYSYLVNLQTMTQTNIVHATHTCRHIRRVEPGEVPDTEDPTDDYPSTTVAPGSALNMKAKKPNVLPTGGEPAHKVEPAPPAAVPNPAKGEPKTEEQSKPEAGEEVELIIPVDDMCPNAAQYKVVDDFDATLNQSNIMGGNNNNKYYRIQMLQHDKTKKFFLWTRWGRVGETRGTQTKLQACKDQDSCEKTFAKKFRDKTSNAWDNRDEFLAVVGKYEMLEIDYAAKKEDYAEPLLMTLKNKQENVEYLPSTLPEKTCKLIELLFEKDMYTDALREFEIDVRKMPLGALSTDQIQKGIVVLEELEEVLKAPGSNRAKLERLSSKFYTTIPRDFGRQRPPVIATQDMLQKCYDMCNVLLDIEKANSLMSKAEEQTAEEQDKKILPHPTEAQYASLNAKLRLVEDGSKEFKVVSDAFHKTKGDYGNSKLLNVWRVDRCGERERFQQVNHLDNHHLLWHGTHIATAPAIISTGLRIMPHSGGRVGRGIYLASENGKSQSYTTPESRNKIGCMFLAEAALGRICDIFQDDPSLRKAPEGYDSVKACGRQTPCAFEEITLDEKGVLVPIDKPTDNLKAKHSSFHQDEHLIYNEAQARIRYVITVKKDY